MLSRAVHDRPFVSKTPLAVSRFGSIKRSALFGLIISAIILSLLACTEEESKPAGDISVRPFSVAAVVQGSSVDEVVTALATFIEGVDDTTRGLGSNWTVVGGARVEPGQGPEAAALKLPGSARIIEVCNHDYASQAMSMGAHHGLALPCEIAVVEDGDDVQVVLLNPEAIFGVFFADVPAEAAAGMSSLAAQVRTEIEGLVVDALAAKQASFPNNDVGPQWDATRLAELGAMPYAVNMDLAIPEEARADQQSREAFATQFVETLLEVATIHGQQDVGAKVEGLSVSDWRSARDFAPQLPGGVSLVEMCSPTYAAAALSTGAQHAPALPCVISVWVEGDVLRVEYLDSNFIFPVFFSDAPSEMMESMGGMAAAVQQDLQLIVAEAQRRISAE
ncbi:MAG: DUF302 domain-containing protein [Myxococcota bacterium]|jgi:uncharacterized protein (DUF302 family)|nr:DUF302 domain-containing protein [Myxococcota bacterium]